MEIAFSEQNMNQMSTAEAEEMLIEAVSELLVDKIRKEIDEEGLSSEN